MKKRGRMAGELRTQGSADSKWTSRSPDTVPAGMTTLARRNANVNETQLPQSIDILAIANSVAGTAKPMSDHSRIPAVQHY